MKFFQPCTKEEYDAQVQRFTEEHHASIEKDGIKEAENKVKREEKTHEGERRWQQKHHRLKREGEIARGECTPKGTKQKVSSFSCRIGISTNLISELFQHFVVDLKESPTKKAKQSMAELSRPGHAEKEITHNKSKKAAGQKCIHEPKDAKYMSWHTPFLWHQITDAAKHLSVGYSMSTSRIHDILAAKDPKTFGHISHTTIDRWIYRSGPKPRWSDAALRMAEDGNHPGGQGGRTGILVSESRLP
jgi:hypothetical protein